MNIFTPFFRRGTRECRRSCLAVLLSAGFILLYCLDTYAQDLYTAPIADKVLRLHILANSDSEEDQEIKLAVRDGILTLFRDNLPPDTGRHETEQWAAAHEDLILHTASRILTQNQCPLPVSMKIEDACFPARTYGSLFFPGGTYRALRIVIGKGAGHNWWCVLSPNLCLDLCSTQEEAQKAGANKLERLLAPDDYEKLSVGDENFSFGWWGAELLSALKITGPGR